MLVGSPGRTPFAGYFRGRTAAGLPRLAWAGRIRASENPQVAWQAGEQANAAMNSALGRDRFALIDAAWAALRPLDRGDLSVLLVAYDSEGASVSACGLCELRADGHPIVEVGHPLLGEPGIPERTGFFQPDRETTDWVGVPVGSRWPAADVPVACGWRIG